MRQRSLLLAATMALCLAAAGCGRKQDDTIARVNKRPITKANLQEALEKADNGEAARRMLDSLIVRELIRDEAKTRGIEVGKEELDRRMEALKDYLLAMTGKDYAAWLADTGQTEEDARSRMGLQILTARLVLTDSERQKYFEENTARLKDLPHNNESVIYREIVMGSKAEAEAVRKELLAQATEGKVTGEAFGKIAEERTLDPNARRRGGMAGWVVKGKTGDAKLDEILFKLKPGEVSEPIEYAAPTPPAPPQGNQPAPPQQPQLHRVVMVEKHLAPGPLTLEGNSDIIEEWMMSDQRYQPQLQEFFTNLRAKAEIQITDPRYRSLQDAYRQGREARDKRMGQTGAMAPTGQQPPGARVPAGRINRAAPPRGR